MIFFSNLNPNHKSDYNQKIKKKKTNKIIIINCPFFLAEAIIVELVGFKMCSFGIITKDESYHKSEVHFIFASRVR